MQRVRLKNIHLSNQLRRIEQTLRQKNELAEGLQLIDFEQLKIENQSLNEKIEERNEELLKLKKKTTTTVQVGREGVAREGAMGYRGTPTCAHRHAWAVAWLRP